LVNLVASTNRSRRAHRSGAGINGSGGPHQFGDNFFTYRKGVLIPVTVVVENDPWIRLVMCDLLAQAGYRVAEASTGFSALRLAHREPWRWCCWIWFCQSGPSCPCWPNSGRPLPPRIAPVIVFSGQRHTLRDAVIQADAVIAKPFATDTLLAEVIRSRKRTLDVAAHCGSVTSHLREGDQAVAPRRDEAGDVE
jgi:CheY-like chemotaxis protein